MERFSRVLVVEDDPTDLRLICEILKEDGFQVVDCLNASKALEAVHQTRFGIAVIDLNLPDFNGTQLLAQMLKIDPDVHAIIYTGEASYDSAKESINLGAFGYVEKLSDPSELLSQVHRAAHGSMTRFGTELQEAVTQRTRELNRSNKELDSFASVVAHDLRTPLLTISGNADFLSKELAGSMSAAAREYLADILSAVERMDRLIIDLLEYSRVGRVKPASKAVALGGVVAQAVANLDATIRKNQARVEVDSLPQVSGDPTQLVQLFQNLIGNAIKFRRDVPPAVRVCATELDGQWQFAVEDNGIGINTRDFERLFHVFQRLHSSREYPGTGIGLALCKKIVEHHGGRIWVESKIGEGTTFCFTLPRDDAPLPRGR